jgi:uncharacterized protein
MSAKRKDRRIRDPIHDLITFDAKDDDDQLVWRLINTREFQRLRRIRQLGFSELTFPGATHSRLAHSIGVFNTARELLSVIEKVNPSKIPAERRTACLCAALLHDVGHGPFSHVFEGVLKELAAKSKPKVATKKHERWTSEIITGDTEVNKILAEQSRYARRRCHCVPC